MRQTLKRSVFSGLLVVDPIAGRFPQVVVRLESLDHGVQIRVVRLVLRL